MLAALPKAPSRYNPIKDPKEAKFRRDLVFKNLNQNGFIDNDQYKNLEKKKLKSKERKIEIKSPQ